MGESYFKSVDLSLSEAQSLFKLLDIEETGIIKKEQFVMGCLRIHGGAKAIDLITLMSEMRRMQRQWHTHAVFLEDAISNLLKMRLKSGNLVHPENRYLQKASKHANRKQEVLLDGSSNHMKLEAARHGCPEDA